MDVPDHLSNRIADIVSDALAYGVSFPDFVHCVRECFNEAHRDAMREIKKAIVKGDGI